MNTEVNALNDEAILAVVIEKIRQTINEDWIFETDIDASTTFNDDLEIESIEFIKIAAAIQQHFGQQLDVSGWLSGKSIHQLISLSVGDLAAYVAGALK